MRRKKVNSPKGVVAGREDSGNVGYGAKAGRSERLWEVKLPVGLRDGNRAAPLLVSCSRQR